MDYEVKYQEGSVVSFVISAYESVFAFSQQNHYYNIDLRNNRELTLSDILGENYKAVADEQIIAQMKQRAQEEGMVFWGVTEQESGIEGFRGVDETTDFYLNQDGKTVVAFPKYSVGPGYMGGQEFVID